MRHGIQPALALSLSTLIPAPAWAQEPAKWVAPDPWFVYTVLGVVVIGSLLTLLLVRAALIASSWSLADALSEDVELTAMGTNAAGAPAPLLDAAGKPLMITQMRASTSRVIALTGSIVILLMFLGFGAFALYSFAGSGTMPASTNEIVKFLAGGLTLFAPYLVNKFAGIFESFAPKKA
jgi:hypothetical protein